MDEAGKLARSLLYRHVRDGRAADASGALRHAFERERRAGFTARKARCTAVGGVKLPAMGRAAGRSSAGRSICRVRLLDAVGEGRLPRDDSMRSVA